MKGMDLKNFLAGRGFSVSKVASLLNESKQNMSAALSKDDIKTGLVERIAKATKIPLLEFYGAPASEGCSVSGENNIVNNGRDQMASDPGLIAAINKQAEVIERQQFQMGELIQMMKADRTKLENLTKN